MPRALQHYEACQPPRRRRPAATAGTLEPCTSSALAGALASAAAADLAGKALAEGGGAVADIG